MTFDIAHHLTPFLVGFWALAALSLLAVAGLAVEVGTSFVRRHHAVRVRRHEGLLPYYGNLVLHH
jgi:hypothetical protein